MREGERGSDESIAKFPSSLFFSSYSCLSEEQEDLIAEYVKFFEVPLRDSSVAVAIIVYLLQTMAILKGLLLFELDYEKCISLAVSLLIFFSPLPSIRSLVKLQFDFKKK